MPAGGLLQIVSKSELSIRRLSNGVEGPFFLVQTKGRASSLWALLSRSRKAGAR